MNVGLCNRIYVDYEVDNPVRPVSRAGFMPGVFDCKKSAIGRPGAAPGRPRAQKILRRPGRPPLKGAWAKRALEETQPRDSECTEIARPEPRDEIRTAREVPRSRMVVVLLL